MKRIFRYLRGTIQLGLLYSKKAETEALTGYADADWGGDCNDCKSTTGYLFQIGGTAVTWKSKKQSCVALSTADIVKRSTGSSLDARTYLRLEKSTGHIHGDTRGQPVSDINGKEPSVPRKNKTYQHQVSRLRMLYGMCKQES